MKEVTLRNGVKMPIVGFGVFQITKEDTERIVLDAIKAGYRMIDTAQSYFNETEVGDAILKTDVPREELFITTKIWIDNYGYEACKKSVYESLRKLKVDYIDLVLLHQPFSDYYGAYHALEDLYDEGIIKAIGVSNFYPDRLTDISQFTRIAPHVNQVETNPLNQQIDAQANMIKNGVQIEAWAPFGEGKNNMFANETLISIGNKYNKTAAQVVLRWLVQRGVVVASKTSRFERMQENINIFDFELSEKDMETIKALDTKTSLFFAHDDPNTVEFFVQLIKQRKDKI